jgi:transposase
VGKTSKSPKDVLKTAYEVGQASLLPYSHPRSPQKFTQPQLFACLVLKAFFQTDYRGIEKILEEWSDLREVIGIKEVPHFTTLQKAEKRILDKSNTQELLRKTIETALTKQQMKRIVELAAIDGSGFESRHISHYFVRRRSRHNTSHFQDITYTKFPKLGVLCDCSSHMTLALSVGRGPSPDIRHFASVLRDAVSKISIRKLLADAGYDAEHAHQFARNKCGVESIIPPRIGRPTRRLPTGPWRRLMAKSFDKEAYGQRWQVETVFSMLKRILGSALKARKYRSQCRELRLKVITLNIMILLFLFFYR